MNRLTVEDIRRIRNAYDEVPLEFGLVPRGPGPVNVGGLICEGILDFSANGGHAQ